MGELEDLYQSRESRPEDVERISELQRQVKQHQLKLKELEVLHFLPCIPRYTIITVCVIGREESVSAGVGEQREEL